MSFFTDPIPFSDGTRMTGVWTKARLESVDEEHLVSVHLIELPPDQDSELESTFLSAFLPFRTGGFYIVDEHDRKKLIVIQHCPCDQGSMRAVFTDAAEILKGSLARALEYNPDAWVGWEQFFTRAELLRGYDKHGWPGGLAESWTTTELVHGLLAEMCDVELSDIVLGREKHCAFPDEVHECENDVFLDVFAHWGRRDISAG